MVQFYILKKDRNRGKKNCLSVAWDRSFWRLFQWRLLTSYLIMPNWHNSFLKKRTANWRLSTAETCTLWNGVGTGLITIRKVHSVNLGCLWYLRCYHAKEVLHIPQNRFAPDEIFLERDESRMLWYKIRFVVYTYMREIWIRKLKWILNFVSDYCWIPQTNWR